MTRERLLQNISAQVECVRNNGARRRLRKAVAAAKVKWARTAEIERRRADRARTLTVIIDEPGPFVSRSLSGFPARQADHDAVLREITYPGVRPMLVPRKSLVLTDLRGP